MFHFRQPHTAPTGCVPSGGVLPGDPKRGAGDARGRHAQALAYAAQRRRAAQACRVREDGVDAAYWKAGAPAALARARDIRLRQGLSRLP
jgi:hypothetical protein